MIIKNTHSNTFIFNGKGDNKILLRSGDNEISDNDLEILKNNQAFCNDCASGVFIQYTVPVALPPKGKKARKAEEGK